METPPSPTLALLFSSAEQGDSASSSALFAALLPELHRIATGSWPGTAGACRSAPPACSTRRISTCRGGTARHFPDRHRFMAYAARVMRGLIVDYSRNRRAQKRGGQFELTALVHRCARRGAPATAELVRISDALDDLSSVEPVAGRDRRPQVLLRLLVRGDRGDEGAVGADDSPPLDQGPCLPARRHSATPICPPDRRRMPNPHRDSWQSASPYLDTALDLPPEERAAWLACDSRAATRSWRTQIARWLAECDAVEQRRLPRRRRRRRADAVGPDAGCNWARTGWSSRSATAGWAACGWPSAPTAASKGGSPSSC